MHLWWCKGVKLVFRDGLTFLVGLNESFSQIRSQILLIDSIPPINKVFSLFSQEQQQRNIASQISVASGGVDTVNNMAFFVKNNEVKKLGSLSSAGNKYHKKSRPFCTNCNFYRHTVEKCYEIMVLPDYKARHKPKNPSQSIGVNQVSTLTNFNEISYQHSGNVGKFLTTLILVIMSTWCHYYPSIWAPQLLKYHKRTAHPMHIPQLYVFQYIWILNLHLSIFGSWFRSI